MARLTTPRLKNTLRLGTTLTVPASRAGVFQPALLATRAALVAAVAAGLALTPGRLYVGGAQAYLAAPGATVCPGLPGLVPADTSHPEHFAAAGTGAGDDTAALAAWIAHGGRMGADGAYRIAAAGPNAGGVIATITRSLDFEAGPNCRFIGAANLDADLIRIQGNPALLAGGLPSLRWQGGTFDISAIRNSTSLPSIDEYPAANPGASATCDGLYITGEVTVGGVPAAGLGRVEVSGLRVRAGDHWQTAGGDQGLFVGGARFVHIHGCEFEGIRDAGIYASGLTAGTLDGISLLIEGNVYRGCYFGATAKRAFHKVTIRNEQGFNTAIVANTSDVTTGTAGLTIDNIMGERAWNVVRLDAAQAGRVSNIRSRLHGHVLADGSAPLVAFNAHNAAVRLWGSSGLDVTGVVLDSLNPAVAFSTAAVLLSARNGVLSTGNRVWGNFAAVGAACVSETVGEADFNTFWDNRTDIAVLARVLVTGAGSINRGAPVLATAAGASVTGSVSTTTLVTATVQAHRIHRLGDALRLVAAGTFAGAAGTKIISFALGSQQNRPFPASAAGSTEAWVLEIDIMAVGGTTIRYAARLTLSNGTSYALAGTDVVTPTAPWTVVVAGRLSAAADTIACVMFRLADG